MRNRVERLVLLPFSMGCVSESSIAVGGHFSDRPKRNANDSPARIHEDDKEGEEKSVDDEESLPDGSLKSISSILAIPKFQSLLKNFKNLPQLFVYKDEEMEEDNMGMEIGFPTDVKHVTHIGIDGSATSILSRGWGMLQEPQLHAQPLHLTPSEFAMSSQADGQNLSFPSENANHEEYGACDRHCRQSLQRAMASLDINSKSSAKENY